MVGVCFFVRIYLHYVCVRVCQWRLTSRTVNEEEWGDMAAQNVNHNNAQHGAGAGNNAGEEEREPIERPHNGEGGAQQGGNFVHMPAVMAEMPQVVTPGGQIDAERLLEHMQLLQVRVIANDRRYIGPLTFPIRNKLVSCQIRSPCCRPSCSPRCPPTRRSRREAQPRLSGHH